MSEEEREREVEERHIDLVAAQLIIAAWAGVDNAADESVFNAWLEMRKRVRTQLDDEWETLMERRFKADAMEHVRAH